MLVCAYYDPKISKLRKKCFASGLQVIQQLGDALELHLFHGPREIHLPSSRWSEDHPFQGPTPDPFDPYLGNGAWEISTVNKILQVNLCTLKFKGHYCEETEALQNNLAQWYQIIKLIQFNQQILDISK